MGVILRKIIRRVVIDGSVSEECNVGLSVPQGSVISPWLYSTYIDGLQRVCGRHRLESLVHLMTSKSA